MKNKLLLSFVLILLVLPMGLAQEDLIFKQGQAIDLQVPCIFNKSTCDNTFICNLTTNYPNSILLVNNQLMENQTSFYNYTFTSADLNISGLYPNTMVCNNGEFQGAERFVFEVTPTGTFLETGESILFVLLTVAVFIFFLLSFYFALITPYSNEANDNGMVIKVTKLKYVKLFFIMLSYILFIWFLNSLVGISENFISLTLFAGFVGFLFQTLNSLALYFGIFIIVLAFFEIIRDANFNHNLKLLMGAATRR
ncbi:hypothetical protein LCGC14_1497230 [marine sediment metagenome]|uniref:Uncharacterized protein n=1 Tax=marine sediment metagenome TaxID=412755 RepID=A0A0F9JR20_9ZZZZ